LSGWWLANISRTRRVLRSTPTPILSSLVRMVAVHVSADPNLLFFGRCERASSSSCVFFRSASLTRLLRG
jgi:hypothetical protein